jgi:hypothetical protein
MQDDRNRKQEPDDEEIGRSDEGVVGADDEFDDDDEVGEDIDEVDEADVEDK